MTDRAKARTTPPVGSAPVWLRLEAKTIEADGLTLEFVAAAQRSGHGQRPDQLGELLAAGDRVRVVIRLGGPAEVTIELVTKPGTETSLGGLGTPAAEEVLPPLPPPAEGEVNEEPAPAWVHEGAVPVYDLPALAAEVAADSLRGMPGQVMTQPAPPLEQPPEERQVAITQELAPLEPGGGDEEESRPPPGPPPDGEHGVMLAGAPPEEPRRQARPSTARPRDHHLPAEPRPPVGPARLAELRAQIAAGKYEPFALFRKAATR